MATRKKPAAAAAPERTPLAAAVEASTFAPKRVPIDSLVPDPKNARTHDARNLGTISVSLAEFGQVELVLAQKGTNRVIGGHGRIESMRAAGVTHCWVHELDVDDARAAALSVMLNKSAELAGWDFEALSGQLAWIQGRGVDLALTGFADFEIEPLLAADWSPPAAGELPGPGGESGGGPAERQAPSEDGSHAVVFGRDAWETVGQAVALKRENEERHDLTEAQCLELICASYLRR